jgi:transcriptional regulator with XRE-family HTH domain
MRSNLGKFLRKLRIDNDEYLKNMAEKLDVSISLLSAVENGVKKASTDLVDKIINAYSLTDEQIDKLLMYVMEANNEVNLDLSKLNEDKIDLTYRFARNVSNLSDNDISLIREILKEADKR